MANGRAREAGAILREAERLQEEAGSASFTAGDVFGTMLRVAASANERDTVMRKAEQVLQGQCLSHVNLRFYFHLIETSLEVGDWTTLERAASALEAFTHAEPLPGVDFWIARGRALAAFGSGVRSEETKRELRRLRDAAADAGLHADLPRLEQALAIA
jgi:hypothetical protein